MDLLKYIVTAQSIEEGTKEKMKDEEKELIDADIKWISFKQQFFNSTIIADRVFKKSGSFIKLAQRTNSENYVKSVNRELGIPVNHRPNEKFSFKFCF